MRHAPSVRLKIRTVQNRGRPVYQRSFYEGGQRERKTFGKLSVAKREAELVLMRPAWYHATSLLLMAPATLVGGGCRERQLKTVKHA